MRTYPRMTSQIAVWSRRLAVLGLAGVLAGAGMARFGVVPPVQGLVIIAGGAACSAMALLLALAAYAEIWRSGAIGLTRANLGFVLALLTLAYPAYQVARAYRLPPINDISTDLKDPPAFSRARLALSARAGHVPGDSSEETRSLQRQFYPEIEPVVLEMGPEEAYSLVLEALAGLKWQIVDQSPPSVRSGAGRIDAVDRTRLLRFADDITVRIRPLANETRIDIRSASRVGRHDLGANAERIKALTAALNALSPR